MKAYQVIIKGGHVGSGSSVELTFYFQAKNIFVAIDKAKKMPCVKRNNPNAIIEAKEISLEEYEEGKRSSAYKVYNTIKSK